MPDAARRCNDGGAGGVMLIEMSIPRRRRPHPARAAAALIALLGILGAAGAARAGDGAEAAATAAELAARAQALADRGDRAGAVAGFRAALAAAPAAEAVVYRCRLGLAFRAQGDLGRAHRFLVECADSDADLPAVDEGKRALQALRPVLADSQLAEVHLITTPEGVRVRLSGFEDDEELIAPHVLWLAEGSYQLDLSADGHRAQSIQLVVRPARRTPVLVRLERDDGAVPVPGEISVDFADDTEAGPGDQVASADPRPQEHPSLLPDRYRRGLADGPDDTVRRTPPRPGPPRQWITVRAGIVAGRPDGGDELEPGGAVAFGLERRIGGRLALGGELALQQLDGDERGVRLSLPVTAWLVPRHERGWSPRAGVGAALALAPEADDDALSVLGHLAIGATLANASLRRALIIDLRIELGLSAPAGPGDARALGLAATIGFRF